MMSSDSKERFIGGMQLSTCYCVNFCRDPFILVEFVKDIWSGALLQTPEQNS